MCGEFSGFLPLFHRIDGLLKQKDSVAVAIEGNSAAGKSSLAGLLRSTYSCNVFSMDDFFLRPAQRTPGRLGEPGGNIDYERFGEEIIRPLKSGAPFAYMRYDCRTQELSGPVPVDPSPLNVVEGVYSMHPLFFGAYDIKVFLALGEEEQRRRLFERDAALYGRFTNEWIPMENRYFDHYGIREKCDFVFKSGE